MEFQYTKEHITFKKPLSPLDEFTLSFVNVLDKQKLTYVLISGYVAILFGRSRTSEDIDLFLEKLPLNRFVTLWNDLKAAGFECINAETEELAYEYLMQHTSLRFAKDDEFIPNMELCFPKREDHQWALDNRRKVLLNEHTLYISPMEAQIAYKLSMASEKDIEDARYLFNIFKEHLDDDMLTAWYRKLKIDANLLRYLK